MYILLFIISGVQTKMRKFIHNIKRINIKEIQMKISNGKKWKKSTAKVSNDDVERIHEPDCILQNWKT